MTNHLFSQAHQNLSFQNIVNKPFIFSRTSKFESFQHNLNKQNTIYREDYYRWLEPLRAPIQIQNSKMTNHLFSEAHQNLKIFNTF